MLPKERPSSSVKTLFRFKSVDKHGWLYSKTCAGNLSRTEPNSVQSNLMRFALREPAQKTISKKTRKPKPTERFRNKTAGTKMWTFWKRASSGLARHSAGVPLVDARVVAHAVRADAEETAVQAAVARTRDQEAASAMTREAVAAM